MPTTGQMPGSYPAGRRRPNDKKDKNRATAQTAGAQTAIQPLGAQQGGGLGPVAPPNTNIGGGPRFDEIRGSTGGTSSQPLPGSQTDPSDEGRGSTGGTEGQPASQNPLGTAAGRGATLDGGHQSMFGAGDMSGHGSGFGDWGWLSEDDARLRDEDPRRQDPGDGDGETDPWATAAKTIAEERKDRMSSYHPSDYANDTSMEEVRNMWGDLLAGNQDALDDIMMGVDADESRNARRAAEINAMMGSSVGGGFAGGQVQAQLSGTVARAQAQAQHDLQTMEKKMAFLGQMMQSAERDKDRDLQKWLRNEMDETALTMAYAQADALISINEPPPVPDGEDTGGGAVGPDGNEIYDPGEQGSSSTGGQYNYFNDMPDNKGYDSETGRPSEDTWKEDREDIWGDDDTDFSNYAASWFDAGATDPASMVGHDPVEVHNQYSSEDWIEQIREEIGWNTNDANMLEKYLAGMSGQGLTADKWGDAERYMLWYYHNSGGDWPQTDDVMEHIMGFRPDKPWDEVIGMALSG